MASRVFIRGLRQAIDSAPPRSCPFKGKRKREGVLGCCRSAFGRAGPVLVRDPRGWDGIDKVIDEFQSHKKSAKPISLGEIQAINITCCISHRFPQSLGAPVGSHHSLQVKAVVAAGYWWWW